MRVRYKVFLYSVALSLVLGGWVTVQEYRSQLAKSLEGASMETVSRVGDLLARGELVLDKLFSRLEAEPTWVLAHGVAKLEGETWKVSTQAGEVESGSLEKFLRGNDYLISAYLWGPNQMLFLKQRAADQFSWKVTRFVPQLMNLTLELGGQSMRMLVNDRQQIIGVTRNRAEQVYTELLKNLPSDLKWEALSKGEQTFVRASRKIPRSNLWAVSVVTVEGLSSSAVTTLVLRFLSLSLLGVVFGFFLSSQFTRLRNRLLVAQGGGASETVDPDWREIQELISTEQPPAPKGPMVVEKAPSLRGIDPTDIKGLAAFLTNEIKAPIVSILSLVRLLKADKKGLEGADHLAQIEGEARQACHTLDLTSLYSHAESFEKPVVCDLAGLLGQMNRQYSREFSKQRFLVECEQESEVFVPVNESHFRRVFDTIGGLQRENFKLQFNWGAKVVDNKVLFYLRDRNGAVSEEDWQNIEKPYYNLSERPPGLMLAISALMGSFSYYGVVGEYQREMDGFRVDFELPLLSSADYEAAKESGRNKELAAPPETSVERTEPDQLAELSTESGIEMPTESRIEDEPTEIDFSPEASDPKKPLEPPVLVAGEEEEVTQEVELSDGPFVPQGQNSLLDGGLPDLEYATKRKKPIDDFRVKVRAPRGREWN